MKECKNCNGISCGAQGSDNVSATCGTKTTHDMTNFETGAVRDTGGKGRMDLLPMCALIRISKHMEDALTHYPERNWEKGLPMHSMLDSALRHLVKYMDGQTDEDHLCAAATNLLMALWTEEKQPDMQDIPSRCAECSKPGLVDCGTSVQCDCYRIGFDGPECTGTKEIDNCNCGGNPAKCDFYPNVRERATRG